MVGINEAMDVWWINKLCCCLIVTSRPKIQSGRPRHDQISQQPTKYAHIQPKSCQDSRMRTCQNMRKYSHQVSIKR